MPYDSHKRQPTKANHANRPQPLQVLKEAKQIARDYGCFVVEKADPKGTRYLVYRRMYDHNECVGTRFSVTNFH